MASEAKPSGMNGSRLLYWIMGVLFVTTMTIAGAMGTWLNARLTDVEQTQRHRGDRVIALESQVSNFERQLDRIEAKLDEVLKERRGPGR